MGSTPTLSNRHLKENRHSHTVNTNRVAPFTMLIKLLNEKNTN